MNLTEQTAESIVAGWNDEMTYDDLIADIKLDLVDFRKAVLQEAREKVLQMKPGCADEFHWSEHGINVAFDQMMEE